MGHYSNGTRVRVFDMGSPYYGAVGRIVNARTSVGVQAFVLLDDVSLAQEFHISQIEPDAPAIAATCHEVTPAQAAELRDEFERAIGALPPARVVPVLPPAAIRCAVCNGWGGWDDIICSRCDGSGIRPEVRRPVGATIHVGNLAAALGTGDTITAKASERLILARFLDHLEAIGIALGEYGKSEGGGSPLTPVGSATEVLEAYLRPIRRSVAR